MVRAVVLVSIASAGMACRPAPSTTRPSTSTPSVPDRAPPRKARSGLDALDELYHTDVFQERSLAVPGGTVVAYTYDRLESEIGRRAAAGHDVEAELAAEEQRCEAERAALEPDQREHVESMEPSCEALASAALFSDEQLTSGCTMLGVAYLDAKGELLDHFDIDDPCVDVVDRLEALDLSPAPDDELLLVATFSRYGKTTRGEWGSTETLRRVHVLDAGVDGGEAHVVEDFAVELEVTGDGGACDVGTRRSLRLVAPGVLELFSQDYRDCDDGCIEPTDEAAADADPSDLCQREPIEAERATWDPDERAWSTFEPFVFDGDALPEGTL